jgi:lysine 2,3-aminomutase
MRTCDLNAVELLRGRPYAPEQRSLVNLALRRFPLRLTAHLRELVGDSPAVAAQFLPDAREVTSTLGEQDTFLGLLPTGVPGLQRMYLDRCIVMPQMSCPAHCRFCFRRPDQDDRVRPMDAADMQATLSYIAADPRLGEVLITGGEPVMDRRRLARLLAGLRDISHIGPIRVACRALVTDPARIDSDLIALLVAHQDLRAGRPVEVALHCNHADELSSATVERLARLRESGLHVYNQTVLLRGVNAQCDTLLALLRALRCVGVETYHLYVPDPVRGTDHMRPSLQQALELKSGLRERATGRLNPALIVTTRVGKVELGVDGWVVQREPNGRHLWIRTPYTPGTFLQVDPRFCLPAGARVDGDGHIVVRYLDGAPEG